MPRAGTVRPSPSTRPRWLARRRRRRCGRRPRSARTPKAGDSSSGIASTTWATARSAPPARCEGWRRCWRATARSPGRMLSRRRPGSRATASWWGRRSLHRGDIVRVISRLCNSLDCIEANAEARRIYLRENGEPLEPADMLRNPDYAATLERLAARGSEDFYTGELAKRDRSRSGGERQLRHGARPGRVCDARYPSAGRHVSRLGGFAPRRRPTAGRPCSPA